MADGKAGFVWACVSVWCGLSQRNDHTNGRPGPAHRQIISVGRIGGISAGEAIMAHSTHKASPLFRFTKPCPKVNNLSISADHHAADVPTFALDYPGCVKNHHPLGCLSQNDKENLKTGFKGASLSTKLDMVEGDEGGCAYCAPPTDPTLKPGCGAAHEPGRKQRAWAGTHRGLEGGEGTQENPRPLLKGHQHKHHPATSNMTIHYPLRSLCRNKTAVKKKGQN